MPEVELPVSETTNLLGLLIMVSIYIILYYIVVYYIRLYIYRVPEKVGRLGHR